MRYRSGYGWSNLIEGIIFIILGVITLIRPNFILTSFVILYALAAIVIGIADIVAYVRMDRFTGFAPMVSLITGVLSVMTGFMLLIHQDAGKWVMLILFPLWFIAHCISRLSQLQVIRYTSGKGHYYFTMIVNIIGLILGVVMIFDSVVTYVSMGILVGIYLILLGVDCIMQGSSKMGSR